MANLDELLAQIPIGQIAAKLGVDEATAKAAVSAAVPTLVGGLGANAKDAGGSSSLQSALQSHASSGLLDGGVNIDDVDTGDGEKIVHNVFGDNKSQVAQALGGITGAVDSSLVSKVLPMLAPIVMAYLAKQFLGGKTAASGNGGLGDILGGMLGGQSGGGLGDLLGGLLGGGRK